ncbi:hypothetical protein Tco_0454087 [Tanacetum coccineum]
MDGRGVGSCVMLGLAPSGPSFSISPSVKLSVAGRGGARKGGSCVIISDLVVMAKVDASDQFYELSENFEHEIKNLEPLDLLAGYEQRWETMVWYVIGVATLRALVRAGDQTSGDARSGYMISGDAKSWVVRIYSLSYSTIVQLIENIGTTTGSVFLLMTGYNSNPSTQHGIVGSSTMESEFVALAATGKEVEWLKNLLLEIPFHMYNGKSRHLGVRHSMIHERITNGVVSLEFVRSQQNLDDHFTKGLARDLVIKSAERMGLKSN